MPKNIAGPEIEKLIQLLSKLPSLGPRSARRVALHLIKKKQALLEPLGNAMLDAAQKVIICQNCGNLDTKDPCMICTDSRRDDSIVIVVEDVSDLWALERAGTMRVKYHVLGGHLSALDGIEPQDLNIKSLIERVSHGNIAEVILAMNATVEGQTTAHYITEHLSHYTVKISRLAHGVPVGGELSYMDDGTLAQALHARTKL